MSYILFTGAPGSKWSSVVKNIYWSEDINQSDYKIERTYWHDADTPGSKQLMHIGAYWDPGMEFEIDDWDTPFATHEKTKIIKSHVFAYHLDFLQPKGFPIVLVYRNDFECYDWWKKCGEFNITYPNYHPYYQNLNVMWDEIQNQNKYIMQFIKNNPCKRVYNNFELANELNITQTGIQTKHNYTEKDITVYVYK